MYESLYLSADAPILWKTIRADIPLLKITSSLTALLDPSRRETASLLSRLAPGQKFSASVISIPRAGVAQLQIGLTALLARSRVPLASGMQLELTVTKLQPVPELQILHVPTPVRPRDQVLRAALPRQIPLTEVFQGLAQHARGDRVRLPSDAQQVIRKLLARGTMPAQLSATNIREQLRTSGLFLEQSLSLGASPAAGDLKLDLLRLLRLLQPQSEQAKTHAEANVPQTAERSGSVLDQLVRLLEGAVARIQTQQTASLSHEQGTRQVWQFDLPMLVAGQHEAVQVRIERDERRSDDVTQAEPKWSIMLRFEFAITGTIQARIVMNGERVASSFWCERKDTERHIGEALPILETAFKNAGLEVGRLASIHGEPPDPVVLPKPTDKLLDMHA